ncbi:MAG TPA: tRNA lysidine(34) synthetase TilS [Arenimonas sp.]|uniref:tRNA lysidine(34) synthetase TilS n=1 Tax=Arenimonas sp. TaxID=1872635 RepID=UPI002D7EFB70|nr:tRNA lysidine(34) synthetase TilS [Arenimonas sp.]HEU0152838.1 tRNA lysidine(34) synthetase TilS [Arenimonas sp.]
MPLTSPPPSPGCPIRVAFSGGRDSTVLLHWLASSPAVRAGGLRALHVDHGLQVDSAAWARHCADACRALGVDFESRRVAVRDAGDGLEAAAREARYEALAEGLQPGERVALAHHRDDQAETVLLRLLRGSGDGLAAMRPLRRFGAGWLWRPLLDQPRDALARYARDHGLRWVEDPSNATPQADRNFLRLQVMPALAARWPGAAAGLARSAALLARQGELLAGEDARRLAQVQGLDPGTVSVPALMALAPAWRDRVLRHWLATRALPPLPPDGLRAITDELVPARADGEPAFAWSGAVVRRWRDLLYAGPALAPLPEDFACAWDGPAPLSLPTGDTLALLPGGAFEAPLQVRARQGGERLVLPGRAHSSELKHVLQDLGVPPWLRARLPLLFDARGQLLAAGDVALAAPLHDWLAARGACLRLQSPTPPCPR